VWESIVDASAAESSVGDTKENVVRASCFYRYEDGGIGRLTIEDAAAWARRREEERKDFEDRGVLLPDDQPVSGLGDEASSMFVTTSSTCGRATSSCGPITAVRSRRERRRCLRQRKRTAGTCKGRSSERR